MDFLDEAEEIWNRHVPEMGQANTVEGELLRAVERLRDEAQRNGNMNWDEGYQMFLSYLEKHLTDSIVFSGVQIQETKEVLDRLRDFDDPYLEEDLYDNLLERVVEYFRHYGSIPHEKDSNQYR